MQYQQLYHIYRTARRFIRIRGVSWDLFQTTQESHVTKHADRISTEGVKLKLEICELQVYEGY